MAKVCARRTNASYTARLPCGWYLPITSPTMRAHLRVARLGSKAHLLHGVENAAMHRLQSVAHVGQRAADDHRHRIVEIRPAHLLFNVDGLHVQRAGPSRCRRHRAEESREVQDSDRQP